MFLTPGLLLFILIHERRPADWGAASLQHKPWFPIFESFDMQAKTAARLIILLVLRFLFRSWTLVLYICGKRSHDCPAPASSKKYSLLQLDLLIHCGLGLHATFDKGHLPPVVVLVLHCGTHPSPYASNILKTWVLRDCKWITKLTQSEFSCRHVQL